MMTVNSSINIPFPLHKRNSNLLSVESAYSNPKLKLFLFPSKQKQSLINSNIYLLSKKLNLFSVFSFFSFNFEDI